MINIVIKVFWFNYFISKKLVVFFNNSVKFTKNKIKPIAALFSLQFYAVGDGLVSGVAEKLEFAFEKLLLYVERIRSFFTDIKSRGKGVSFAQFAQPFEGKSGAQERKL